MNTEVSGDITVRNKDSHKSLNFGRSTKSDSTCFLTRMYIQPARGVIIDLGFL